MVVVFALLIFKIYSINIQSLYLKSIQEEVVEIYTVRGRPTQRSAKLSNNEVIDVPSKFVPYIQAGDSILKKSKSSTIKLIHFSGGAKLELLSP